MASPIHVIGRLAIKHHPDKNPDDPSAHARFQSLSLAYQTLSSPETRKKYNEFGARDPGASPEGGFVDPEEVFSALFGGERWRGVIGEISLGREMKTALQEAEEAEESGVGEGASAQAGKGGKRILSAEEKAKKDEKARKISEEVIYLSPVFARGSHGESTEG